jgi:hypothetical protein
MSKLPIRLMILGSRCNAYGSSAKCDGVMDAYRSGDDSKMQWIRIIERMKIEARIVVQWSFEIKSLVRYRFTPNHLSPIEVMFTLYDNLYREGRAD